MCLKWDLREKLNFSRREGEERHFRRWQWMDEEKGLSVKVASQWADREQGTRLNGFGMMVWMRSAPIGLCVWTLGCQLEALFGKIVEPFEVEPVGQKSITKGCLSRVGAPPTSFSLLLVWNALLCSCTTSCFPSYGLSTFRKTKPFLP